MSPKNATILSREDFIKRIQDRLDQSLSRLFITMTDNSDDMAQVKSAIFDCNSAEGKQLCNYLHTVCLWIEKSLANLHYTDLSDLITLLPYVSLKC